MKATQLTRLFVLLLSASLVFTSCEEDETMKRANKGGDMKEMDEPMNTSKKGAPAPGELSITEIALVADIDDDGDPDFEQLVAALMYVDAKLNAGLVNLFLNGTDQYTVFAPTDAAFEDLYVALSAVLGAPVDEISDVPAEIVLDVLYYHVAEGRRASNSVVPPVKPRTIETLLEGATFDVESDLSINTVGNGIAAGLLGDNYLPDIIGADVSASNGIIHVVDAVLLPIDPTTLAD